MTANLRAAAPYVALLAGAAVLYVGASQIDYSHRPGSLGPDFWPKVAIGLIAIVCLIEIVRALAFGRAADAVGVADRIEQGAEADEAPRRPALLAAGLGLTVGYGALVGILGFPLATFLFLVAFMYVGGFRAHAALWLLGLLGSTLLTLLFLKVVYVSLPRGVAPFDRITDVLTSLF